MAFSEGVEVNYIKLFLLSGLAKIDDQCSNPISNFRIAISGPLLSFCIAIICFSFIYILSDLDTMTFYLFRQIGRINLILGFFNLLPILPLNGGVIVKSLVWYFTNDQRKGHISANKIGRYLSFFALFIGGLIIFTSGGFNGVLLIVMSWFGLTSYKSQEQTIALQDTLSKVFIKDVAKRNFRVLDENKSLRLLSELNISSSEDKYSSEWVLLSNSGRWVGYITDENLKEIPAKYWDNYSMASYKKPLEDLPSIIDNKPIWHAVLKLEKIKEGRLLVINSAGLPSGTIDKADLGEEALKKLGIILPKTFIDLARKSNSYPLGISLPKIVYGMINSGLIQKSELDKLTK